MEKQTYLINRYEIREELGKGGNGRVYKVWDHHMGKEWAVKELLEGGQELETLKMLSHPLFPRIVDAFREGKKEYLVMDHLKGITLEELLKKGALEEKKAIGVAKQIIEALRYLHEFQPTLLYLDLKPSNILVTEEGRVSLVDVGSVVPKGREGRLSGTFGFASPEQIHRVGDGRGPDERSDIFSLGMVLFCMLTGRLGKLPVAGGGKRYGILVRKYNPLVTPTMEQIVERCTRPVPGRRFLSLRDVGQQLEQLEKRLEKKKKIRGPLFPYPFFLLKKADWQQEKSILLTQGKPGLYIAGLGVVLGLLLGALFPTPGSMAMEERPVSGSMAMEEYPVFGGFEREEVLPVTIRDSMTGRKILVRKGAAYETTDSLVFELDWENLENACTITIFCREEGGRNRSFQLDCVKK